MACAYFGAVLPKTADGTRLCWLFLDGLTLHGDSEESQKKQMKVFYVHNVVDKLMCGLFLSLDNLDSLVIGVSDDVESPLHVWQLLTYCVKKLCGSVVLLLW